MCFRPFFYPSFCFSLIEDGKTYRKTPKLTIGLITTNPSNWRKTSNLPMFIIIALALKLSTLEAQ
jgi:hypothetical protein